MGHGLISQDGLLVATDHQGTTRQLGPVCGALADQCSFDVFGVPTDALKSHTNWATPWGAPGGLLLTVQLLTVRIP